MERLDAIVAGIGVLVVAAALGGVLAAGPAHGAQEFTLAFPVQRSELAPQESSFAGDGAVEIAVPVEVANLTALEFAWRVEGAGPRVTPDQVEVVLQSPDGLVSDPQTATLAAPGAGASAEGTFTLSFATAPQARAVRGGSAEEVLGGAPPAVTNGTGTWLVLVSVAADTTGLAHAETHTVTVTVAASHYAAVAQPVPANPR